VQLFRKVKEALPPTPAKAHYTFNLRDVARVVFGIMMVPSGAVGDDTTVISRAWTHEALRVFGDRLVDDGDRHMVASFTRAILRSTFSEDPDRLLAHLDADGDSRVDTFEEMSDLMFGDFGVTGGEDSHDEQAVGLMVESDSKGSPDGVAAALIGGEQHSGQYKELPVRTTGSALGVLQMDLGEKQKGSGGDVHAQATGAGMNVARQRQRD